MPTVLVTINDDVNSEDVQEWIDDVLLKMDCIRDAEIISCKQCKNCNDKKEKEIVK